MIKGITFDFGGTIATGALQKDDFQKALLEYLNSLGYAGGQTKLRKVRRGMLKTLRRVRSQNREMRFEDLYTGVLCSLGMHPERQVINHIHQLYIRSFKTEFIPGVEQVFKTLKKRFSLAIISNSMSEVSRYTLKKSGLDVYFDAIVISRDIGMRKPHPEIFNYALTNLGIKNRDAIHVGDSLEQDVQGAKNAGVKAIWVKGREENIHIKPDYTVNSLEEVPVLLEATEL